MSKGDALAVGDFDKIHFSATHWLDISKIKCIGKGKKPDPNCLFNIFDLLDCDACNVHDQVMTEVSENFNQYSLAATVVLAMRKQSLLEWLTNMRKYDTPGDEIVLYALSRMTRVHSIVYSKMATWCTVAVSQPILPSDLHKTCTVKLMYLGKRGFGELVQKPLYIMPVYQPNTLGELVYSCGYYEVANDQPQSEVTPPTQGNSSTEVQLDTDQPIQKPKDVVLSSVANLDLTDDNDESAENVVENTMLENTNNESCIETGMDPCDHPVTPPFDFPLSTSVCTTTTSSALNEFNPLEESKPNLELDMTDQNEKQVVEDDPILTTKDLVDDAKVKKWKVSVRKLTMDEVEFLSGPKLLPGLGENVIQEHNIPASTDPELEADKKGTGTSDVDSDATIPMSEGENDQLLDKIIQ